MASMSAVLHRKVIGGYRSDWGPTRTPLWHLWSTRLASGARMSSKRCSLLSGRPRRLAMLSRL